MASAPLSLKAHAASRQFVTTASNSATEITDLTALTGFAPLCRTCVSRNHCEAARLLSLEYNNSHVPFIRTYKLRRNEYLYYQGDPARSIYIIRSGSLKSCLSLREKDEYIIGFHLTGDALVADVLGNKPHETSAVALEDSSVCIVPMLDLNTPQRRLGGWHKWILELANNEINRQQLRSLMLRSVTAEGRVISFLLAIAEHFSNQGFSNHVFNLSMSRQDIGNYLGLTVETVSRTLSRLNNMNLLELNRRQITIKEPDELRSMTRVPGAI